MSGRTAWITALVLAFAASAFLVVSGSSGAAERKFVIAYVAAEPLNGPREQAMVRGGRAAAKALGVRYIAAESVTQRGPHSVADRAARGCDRRREAYDPASKPILAKVRAAGILLLSSGDDIAAKRSVSMS